MIPDQIETVAPSRRGLLQTAGLGAVALGAAAATTVAATAPARAQSITDADILNFALNLEYLEAEFYLRATTGHGLRGPENTGASPGTVVGGSQVPFKDPRLAAAAADIASDEHTHVLFLRRALGSAAVSEPSINLSTSFTTLARAAGIVGPKGTFDPFADDQSFILGAYIFEDVGVTAYHGAAPLISDKGYLSAAAGILAVEAYHAGEIRSLIQRAANPNLPTYAEKISLLRAKLSAAVDDKGPIFDGMYNIAPTDGDAVAYSRTPAQVLNVVYGGGKGGGLFFPNGVNGAIK